MPKAKLTKVIDIAWRGENYGSISAASAFREFKEDHLSDSATVKLQRLFKKAGYAFNWSRASWICPESRTSQYAPEKLDRVLKDNGWTVSHSGAVPSVLKAAEDVSDLETTTTPSPRP